MSPEERRFLCPGCGTKILVPLDAGEGDLIQCENCAGVKFRLCIDADKEVLRLVQLVSVPFSDSKIPLDDDTPEGSVIVHDEKHYKLTREFGAFSLEPIRE